MTTTPLEPRVLEGAHVRLEPLSLDHVERLCEIGLDEELWRWTLTNVRTPREMSAYVETALREWSQGTVFPFATVERATGLVVGSTRYGNIDLAHGRVEIGWTWVARAWQRTAINTEAKYLMLRHAFEVLGCGRVELKTDALNQRSRQAILRLGAREEGTLRQHMRTASGRMRDTVYFSILAGEWPEVKSRLEQRLARGDTGRRESPRLRTELRPGDLGHLTHLHGILYAREYGWKPTFEAYVAAGLAEFVEHHDPARERIWFAELDGETVGAIAIARERGLPRDGIAQGGTVPGGTEPGGTEGGEGAAEHVAQLRWFLVHPNARGQGLGRRLLDEALAFCRGAGYRRVILWTVSELKAAAHLYREAGFERVEARTHMAWGKAVTEERYELGL